MQIFTSKFCKEKSPNCPRSSNRNMTMAMMTERKMTIGATIKTKKRIITNLAEGVVLQASFRTRKTRPISFKALVARGRRRDIIRNAGRRIFRHRTRSGSTKQSKSSNFILISSNFPFKPCLTHILKWIRRGQEDPSYIIINVNDIEKIQRITNFYVQQKEA